MKCIIGDHHKLAEHGDLAEYCNHLLSFPGLPIAQDQAMTELNAGSEEVATRLCGANRRWGIVVPPPCGINSPTSRPVTAFLKQACEHKKLLFQEAITNQHNSFIRQGTNDISWAQRVDSTVLGRKPHCQRRKSTPAARVHAVVYEWAAKNDAGGKGRSCVVMNIACQTSQQFERR